MEDFARRTEDVCLDDRLLRAEASEPMEAELE